MSVLDDTAIFIAVVQQGGFSRAAKHLGVSNGLISRRIDQLESKLGVALLKRTTRQVQLTVEGELFWQHVLRIQQELTTAVNLIQSTAKKMEGTLRVTAPSYFGRHYLTPIIMKFLTHFDDIKIDLIITDQQLDPIKDHLDLIIRGAGYLEAGNLKDSSMQMKLLVREKIGWYASPLFLEKYGAPKTPDELANYMTINCLNNKNSIMMTKFNCNDIESCLTACIASLGIGRFTDLNVKNALMQQQLLPVLQQYHWGYYHLHAIFAQQKALPTRTRLLLEFIQENLAEARVPVVN